MTRRLPQKLHHVFHFRIVAQHPSWRNGTVVCRVDESQGIGQLTRRKTDKCVEGSMRTNLSLIFLLYQLSQSSILPFCIHEVEEPVKFRFTSQQGSENPAFLLRQRMPAFHLVKQKVARLLAVVHRIVHLVTHQFVILQQSVVGPFRKQQR